MALPPASASIIGTLKRCEKYTASSGFSSGATRKTMVRTLSLPAKILERDADVIACVEFQVETEDSV